MFAVLANRTYRHLFLAQTVALVGTGLATVALGLLAFDIAGGDAGVVLGTALAIKMIAYVGVAPLAGAIAERLPRRGLLVGLDVGRALVALSLPFASQVWHVYVLIFLLQSASAAFTPAFQATIPEVLPDERDYTRALSLSRLAYDLESLLSPALAAMLLVAVGFRDLFAATTIGFAASALLVLSVALPRPHAPRRAGFLERTTRGMRAYLATPRLRGLLAISLAVASGGAMVIVNTVVLVQAGFGLEERQTAMALAAFGAGSMLVALVLPGLLERLHDRSAMLAGALVLATGTLVGIAVDSYAHLLVLWFVLGAGFALAQTPAGRLLRRSAHAQDRPAIYAAHFALSHACWMATYPLAGHVGSAFGMPAAFAVLAGLALLAVLLAMRVWPAGDPETIVHAHPDLPADHPHWHEGTAAGGDRHHVHHYVIDELHPGWPVPR